MVLVVLLALSASLINNMLRSINNTFEARASMRVRLIVKSSLETFGVAARLAQINYMKAMVNCQNASSLGNAMVFGHRCAAASGTSVDVFTNADLQLFSPAPSSTLMGYPNRIRISHVSSSFSTTRPIFVTEQPEFRTEFFLEGSNLASGQIFLNLKVYHLGKFEAAVRAVYLFDDEGYRVHLDAGEMNLNQQNSHPLSLCPTTPWTEAKYHTLGLGCITYPNVGSGTGLGIYRGNLFISRATDGQIFMLSRMNSGASYIINQAGSDGSVKVFPSYKTQALVNTDDFDIVGEDSGKDELYLVRGAGSSSTIYYHDPVNDRDIPVCRVGEFGWGQSTSGIMSTTGSIGLIPRSAGASALYAHFLLKTDTGSLLSTIVISSSRRLPLPNELGSPVGRYFYCVSVKNPAAQDIENVRSLGYSKSTADTRPYLIL